MGRLTKGKRCSKTDVAAKLPRRSMIEHFESIIFALVQPNNRGASPIFDPTDHLVEDRTDDGGIARALNAAFLIHLSGPRHPLFDRARRFLTRVAGGNAWADTAKFYLDGVRVVHQEIDNLCRQDPRLEDRLKAVSEWVSNRSNMNNPEERTEKIWSLFFPEATGIRAHRQERIDQLRAKRKVTITSLNRSPITDPAREVLFTSNVLLTLPSPLKSFDTLSLSERLKKKLREITHEPQLHWYDHPVQVGVEQGENEVIYGLKGLEAAFEFERERGLISGDVRPVCLLSVSVTHRGLHDIAKPYIEEELTRSGRLKKMDVYVISEADTQRMIDDVLAPAAERYLQEEEARDHLRVFGVDGEYGRHYSFLKSIAPFWALFIQRSTRATFKIDLDQVFPQKELVRMTGASAFEHFTSPLWGAHGLDCDGKPLELGMIAGSLVDEGDIGKSLFSPDVSFPDRLPSMDECIFFSRLPQALSTAAEMSTRYGDGDLDGRTTCIHRIHVTGGTNGILVDSLRRHRPFTPSFIGRAEDQAYLLSVLLKPDRKLAYVHGDGLIMRHDKEAFAQEAIQSAYVSKILGDYLRTLYFSAYARALTDDLTGLKETVDPFTGCFVSRIPATVVYLRFGFRAADFFASEQEKAGVEFVKVGAKRIAEAVDFVSDKNSPLKEQYERERVGWDLYYDTLSAVEEALNRGDGFAMELQKRAKGIIAQCLIRY